MNGLEIFLVFKNQGLMLLMKITGEAIICLYVRAKIKI